MASQGKTHETITAAISTPLNSSKTVDTIAAAMSSAVTPRPLTIVLKIGSSSLSTPDGKFLNMQNIVSLVDTIMKLKHAQPVPHNVILITSGAVSVGCARMAITSRPTNLITKQAVAAVGQCRLMRVYDDMFAHYNQPIAQVLLSRENLSKQHQYINAQNTFHELLRLNIVPIVNENDTVAIEELRFGDNDTISALVASLVQADYLFLLTDVDCLYTADPRRNPAAKRVHVVQDIEVLMSGKDPNNIIDVSMDPAAGGWGTGGMATKIQAARIATTAGVTCCIIHTQQLQNIAILTACQQNNYDSYASVAVGTTFIAVAVPIRGKKRWIAHGCAPQGTLTIDQGACDAIVKKKSLFAVGLLQVSSSFYAHSNVVIMDTHGNEIARGMTNYSSDELLLLRGQPSRRFGEVLGYWGGPHEVINRENLALTGSRASWVGNEPRAVAAAATTVSPSTTNITHVTGTNSHVVAAAMAAAVTAAENADAFLNSNTSNNSSQHLTVINIDNVSTNVDSTRAPNSTTTCTNTTDTHASQAQQQQQQHEQNSDLPPFALVKEYNSGSDNAVAEYRSHTQHDKSNNNHDDSSSHRNNSNSSNSDSSNCGNEAHVELITLQHLVSGITGHGCGTGATAAAVAQQMAVSDLMSQLEAQAVVSTQEEKEQLVKELLTDKAE